MRYLRIPLQIKITWINKQHTLINTAIIPRKKPNLVFLFIPSNILLPNSFNINHLSKSSESTFLLTKLNFYMTQQDFLSISPDPITYICGIFHEAGPSQLSLLTLIMFFVVAGHCCRLNGWLTCLVCWSWSRRNGKPLAFIHVSLVNINGEKRSFHDLFVNFSRRCVSTVQMGDY